VLSAGGWVRGLGAVQRVECGVIDIGQGEPIVLVPGLQGRWEWMQPTVARLAQHYRVIAYSLCDERTSGFPCDPAIGFDNYVEQLGAVLDRAGLSQATLVGVSYGGLIAMEFATRSPARVTRLVLASSLPVDWQPDRRARFYLRAPRLLSPLFVATAPLRLRPEVRAAFPAWSERMRFLASHTWRVVTAPMSPGKMARRVRWADAHRFADAEGVQAPVLVVTGEPGLDRVVPVEVSRRIVARIRRARHVVLPRTGHLGIVTRPEGFCRVMNEFVESGA
jgi:pimeloyl-ACP methyl ester carboxylesterase